MQEEREKQLEKIKFVGKIEPKQHLLYATEELLKGNI